VTEQNGYTVISLEALEQVEIEEMYEFYGYCNDLLVKLNVAGMRVVDVPRQAVYDDEESHIDYRTYIRKVGHARAQRPLAPLGEIRRPRASSCRNPGRCRRAGRCRRRRQPPQSVSPAPVAGSRASGCWRRCSGTAVFAILAIDHEHDDHLDGQTEWKPEPDSIEQPVVERPTSAPRSATRTEQVGSCSGSWVIITIRCPTRVTDK